jgi:hypothetical protein
MNLPATTTSSMSKRSSSAEIAAHQAVASLFERLTVVFGRTKIAEMWTGLDPKLVRQEWAAGLADFTPEEINRGLAACRGRKFAPNLGEFAQLCRPVLDPEIAWYEAVEGMAARERCETGHWSHPAVYRAAMRLSYDLRRSAFAGMRRRWEGALQDEFAKGWVEDVPPIAKQIECRPDVRLPPAAVREYLARAGHKPRSQKSE